ncbi:Fc.00g009750.m01.CDS01 [Cosmosporella sp. VM-42]
MPTSSDEDRPLFERPVESDQASSYAASESEDGSYRRKRKQKQAIRLVSFIFANLAALCGGSIVVFSLYAPVFQSRLHYTQFQVNGVAIAGSIALYLPISVLGYICDRVGVAPLALLSAILFGGGYGLAAGVFRKLDLQYNGLRHEPQNDWSYPLMMFAFVCIGTATCAIYMASISSCAKNFGKGKYRGLALAMPITAFGLSPMWISQAGSRLFVERNKDGSKGDLDVFHFFLFLAILLFSMGIIGTFTLRVVDEQDLIDEAIEELEHSGMLDGSALIGRSERSYGTVGQSTEDAEDAALLDPSKDDDARWKKNWVLNAETRRFLTDRTMWPFALAFLFMVGPGEAFINNLGTVIGTLSPPISAGYGTHTSAATHVSIFGVTSTISRILIGTLTDLLAPSPQTQHYQVTPSRSVSSKFAISRVAFMLFFALTMSVGLVILASGAVQNHAERFWLVSGLVGAGYGAIFSLTPLIVTIIWGVENFATNFGIIAMLPAVGSTFWGLVYSAVYQSGANSQPSHGDDKDLFCYGKKCYSSTFWAEAVTVWVACVLLLFAWKGKGGWNQRGIII